MREAGSAEAGLEALDEESPDLILLDVMMPKVDGWEMLRRVQERHGVGSIPVIMFSGKADEAEGGRQPRRARLHRQAVRPARAYRVDQAAAAGLTMASTSACRTGRSSIAAIRWTGSPKVCPRSARTASSGSPSPPSTRWRVGARSVFVATVLAVSARGGLLEPREGARRPRPSVRGRAGARSDRREPSSYSFPSGHATISFACAVVLAAAIPRLAVAFYVLAGAIAWSRVVVGVHYPLDVLGGALLGLGVGWAASQLFAGFQQSGDDQRHRRHQRDPDPDRAAGEEELVGDGISRTSAKIVASEPRAITTRLSGTVAGRSIPLRGARRARARPRP